MAKDFIEESYKEGFQVRFDVKERLFATQSEFQKVEIVTSTHHGRMLFNDGAAMVSERDEAIYHEMIAHVPLTVHPNPKRVLVIGGGDGGTAREVLRHKSVDECVMVEIDSAVVEGCRKYIPQTSQVFDNPRLNLIIGDGIKYVAEAKEPFDVILVDSTDPVGPAQPLFGRDFYRELQRLLSSDGIVVAQGETPFYENSAQASMLKIMGEFFSVVKPYNFTNMTYPGGLWSFLFASRGLHPLANYQSQRWIAQKLKCFYYSPDIHQASFALPQFMHDSLGHLFKEGR